HSRRAKASNLSADEQESLFSGTIEASTAFTVAPKISGRVREVLVDLGDVVTRDAALVILDDEEFIEESRRAESDLVVTEARVREAESRRLLAERTLTRVQALSADRLTSVGELERSEAELQAAEAALAVAVASVEAARSRLRTALIRRGYARVNAAWSDNSAAEERVVVERWVEPGDSVAMNDPMLRVAVLNPVRAIFAVTERDYHRFRIGQQVQLFGDAFFESSLGTVHRLAPTFSAHSRLARVEVEVPNQQLRWRPGMFARLEVTLDEVDDALHVPADAVVRRGDEQVVFLVEASESGETVVRQIPVQIGLRDGDRLQISLVDGVSLSGEVVVLGHQLLRDGSPITIPGARPGTQL
ncbi:MAG: efflux RND transporter periplasmic adaptor subunit, partial [Planctomycetota bacterium]